MKSGGQIILLAAFIFLTVSVTVRGQSLSLLSATATNSTSVNATNANLGSTVSNVCRPCESSPGIGREPGDSNAGADPSCLELAKRRIPLIEFQEVPLTVALENLARQAGFNYLLDPQIGYDEPDRNGQIKPEPIVNLRWENITANHAFTALCQNYGLTMATDTNTQVVLIRAAGHGVNYVTPNFFENDTNVIPLIEFQDVPLIVALENLARQGHTNYLLALKTRYGTTDENGDIKEEPTVSLRWENITATRAFIAVCENYDFAVVKDPATGYLKLVSSD